MFCPENIRGSFSSGQISAALNWKKKWSHFDLKNWVISGTKIRPGRILDSNILQLLGIPGRILVCQWLNFLGQDDSIFSFSDREEINSQ